jgi:hypothetical protein
MKYSITIWAQEYRLVVPDTWEAEARVCSLQATSLKPAYATQQDSVYNFLKLYD